MPAPLPPFIGRYEIKQRLGQGGMGVIYLARDSAIDRLVAVKLLNADIATDELRERFSKEARSSGALTHPNIVTIHDFGEVDGVPYLVMEYVQGETMAALIRRAVPMPVGQKLRWIEQACRALGYAHQRRVIHRDVKPSNLMIDQLESIKVVDFGIARSLDGVTTKMSMVIGTPGYMSPEQIQGGQVDARSDIFALGTVLYELLTYKEAFGGDSPAVVMNHVISGQPQPLSEMLTGPDLSIAAVVDRALQKSPDARFPGMAEFESAIRQARTLLESTGHELTLRTPGRPASDRHQSRRRRTDPVDLARRRAEQIARHLEEARAARRAGDLEAAIIACESALLMDPSSVDALDLVEELRQESTGVGTSRRTVAPITAVAPTPVTARSTQPSDPGVVRYADLSEIELRPGAGVDRPTFARPAPAAAGGTRSTRVRWPWAVLALMVIGAAGTWAVQSGFVPLGARPDSDEMFELAMPSVPETVVTPTPPRPSEATPRARVAPPPVETSTEPDAGAVESPPATTDAAASPQTTTGSPTTGESPPDEPVADPATAAAPVEPPDPLPPPVDEPPTPAADQPDGPIDREAVARLLLLSEGAERNGNLADSLKLYREVLTRDPSNRIAARAVIRVRVAMLLRRAESLILVGDYPGALKELAAVAVYDPTNARAEELREAIEQGRNSPARKKPGPA